MNFRSTFNALRIRLHRPRLASSWEEAVSLAGDNSYQDDDLTRFRVARIALNRAAGASATFAPSVRDALDWITARLAGRQPAEAVDFGGADGSFLRALGERVPLLRGTVIESTAMVHGLPPEHCVTPAFSDHLPTRFDLFYTACALNYVADPYRVLEEAFRHAGLAVVLQRNCFSDAPQFRVQLSSLHANGWGKVPPGWPDRLVCYPHRTLQPAKIMQLAHSHGFQLMELRGNNSGVIGGQRSGQYGVDLFFIRNP